MTQQAQVLLQKALPLSEEERAWSEEIRRRIADLDSGAAKAVPWEEVQRRISSRLTHGK